MLFLHRHDQLPWTFSSTKTSVDRCSYLWRDPEIETPTEHCLVALFLVNCNVFQRLVPSFAPIRTPLNRNFQKDQPKEFRPLNNEVLKAMTTLHKNLISRLQVQSTGVVGSATTWKKGYVVLRLSAIFRLWIFQSIPDRNFTKQNGMIQMAWRWD